MQILAATDFSTRSQRALRRAALLARERDAQLALVHVVDDDQPPDLVALETREAERTLREQVGAMAELVDVSCDPLVVPGDPFDAIVRTAAVRKADLVVMGAHRKQLLRDIFIGTTIERVIRVGRYPVLMVNREAEAPYRTALAAIDVSEPSINAIRTSMKLSLLDSVRLTFVHAFLPLAKGKLTYAGYGRDKIKKYVASERLRAAAEIDAFLNANAIAEHPRTIIVEEGEPFGVISSAVERLQPDLVVVGTHNRSGIAKALLGSVSEAVLRSVEVDILAVSPR